MTQGWAGAWTDTGDTVRVQSESWNGKLAPGGTATIGHNANHNGGPHPFLSPVLNGTACT